MSRIVLKLTEAGTLLLLQLMVNKAQLAISLSVVTRDCGHSVSMANSQMMTAPTDLPTITAPTPVKESWDVINMYSTLMMHTQQREVF